MTTNIKPITKRPTVRTVDGRYLRWSWRYNTFQMKTVAGEWRNVPAHIARCYAAAGFPVSTLDQRGDV